MKKIVIACDSFKGSLTSAEAAGYISAGVRDIYPECDILSLPVADGGEGTVDALIAATGGRKIVCKVNDPLMRPIEATYGILGDNKTAIIEMAAASGLPLIKPEERNPMLTTTYGTGELIKDALLKGCYKFLIGLGGSATNDAGVGMLQALGFRFYDSESKLEHGKHVLNNIVSIDTTHILPQLRAASFIVACDVDNPFSGPDGAAFVFGPQKGANTDMVGQLDLGLKTFSQTIKKITGKDIDNIPGAGAAGGMGGGFVAFLNAKLSRGIDMVLDALMFDQQIKDADLIITGEGRLDKQTIMGKAPMGILQAGLKQGKPVIAVGGSVCDTDILSETGFTAIFPILPYPVPLSNAMDKDFAGQNVKQTIKQIMQVIRQFNK